MKQEKDGMTKRFVCDIIGNMNEIVGCKLDRDWNKILLKFTQPIMIQSFADKFEVTRKEQELSATLSP